MTHDLRSHTPAARARVRLVSVAVAGLVSLVIGPVRAQDRADLERTRIVGSRELPKVTFIVPWRKPQAEAPGLRPPASVLDDALAPLDPTVHRRQVEGHARLQASAAPAAVFATPATPNRNPDPPQEKRP